MFAEENHSHEESCKDFFKNGFLFDKKFQELIFCDFQWGGGETRWGCIVIQGKEKVESLS